MRSTILVLALCAMLGVATNVAAQTLRPHIVGWEHYFSVTAKPLDRKGPPEIGGYVISRYGSGASHVQLLVESLDATGQVVAQRVEWLGGDVGPFSRRYFEVPAPAPAQTYRVSIFTFDLIQASRLEAP